MAATISETIGTGIGDLTTTGIIVGLTEEEAAVEAI
jgi:hypothetical protein